LARKLPTSSCPNAWKLNRIKVAAALQSDTPDDGSQRIERTGRLTSLQSEVLQGIIEATSGEQPATTE
jgi:hypothetical protein